MNMLYSAMRRMLLGLATVLACADAPTEMEPDTDAMAALDVPAADLPPQPCTFGPVTHPEAEPGRCSGRTEAQCEAEGCWAVYGHPVTACTTARAECDAASVFLGCGQMSICKDDGFLCSEDGQSVYAVGRRCLPPTGWTACRPDGVDDGASLYDASCDPS